MCHRRYNTEVPAAMVEVWSRQRRGLMVQCPVGDSDLLNIYWGRQEAVTEKTLGRITVACCFENDQWWGGQEIIRMSKWWWLGRKVVPRRQAKRWFYSEYIFTLEPALLADGVWIWKRRVRGGNKVWGLAKRWMDVWLPHTEIRVGSILGGSAVKNLPVNAEDIRDMGSIPVWGRAPGEGNGSPLQYACLENLVDRGA